MTNGLVQDPFLFMVAGLQTPRVVCVTSYLLGYLEKMT